MVVMLCELAHASRSLHLAIDAAAAALLDRPGAGNDGVSEGAATDDAATGTQYFIDRDIFDRAPESLRFGLLRLAAHRIAPRQVPLSRTAFDALDADWNSIGKTAGEKSGPASRRAWDLGNGVMARATDLGLVVTSAADTCSDATLGGSGEILAGLAVPGSAELPDGTRILARVTTDATEAAHARDVDREVQNVDREARARNREVLDADQVGAQLTIRYRRPGDVFHPLGAPGRRKLKSFLIDRKIPVRERDTIPLVCSGNTVIWVAGVRIAEPARVTQDTRRFLLLSRTGC
jgi:tRNA(Ile)-lysidine synthetase-like protein